VNQVEFLGPITRMWCGLGTTLTEQLRIAKWCKQLLTVLAPIHSNLTSSL